jgi:hypothetical protein
MTRGQAIQILCLMRSHANDTQLSALGMAITLLESVSDDHFEKPLPRAEQWRGHPDEDHE